jgi:hypothetical protein
MVESAIVRVFGKILGSFLDNNGGLPLHSEDSWETGYSTTGASNQDANADGIIDINVTWDSQYGCDNKEPIRADECYWNGIISLKEAHYLAECACNDRFWRIVNETHDIEQNQQIWISDIINVSAPSLYL